MSDTKRTALGTLLIERGLLDQERLDEALEIGDENGERLGEVLVRLAWVSEDDLAKTLADQWQLRYCERSEISFDGEALRRMSREDAARLEALPVQVGHDGVLVVALAEPTEARLHALRTLLGDHLDFVVVPKGAIDAGLRSDLLAMSGVAGGQFSSNDDEGDSDHVTFYDDGDATEDEPAESSTAQVDLPRFDGFDEAAHSMMEALETHLGSLRVLLEEADAQRERDRMEIERLQGELASRIDELGERDEAIESTQQMLRDLADRLVRAEE